MIRIVLGARRWLRVLLCCLSSVLIVAIVGLVLAIRVHGFLAIQAPLDSRMIVVSGTLPDSALEKIVADVGANKIAKILTVGGPISRGSHLSSYRDYANLAADTLRQLGIPTSVIVAIPSPISERDRVFATAHALGAWLKNSETEIAAINVYALGVRSRRTLILYREALGPDIDIGIVSIPSEDYDPSAWWATSEGFRTVVSELIAYLYVKTLFQLTA